ncbi:hypothetical protein ACE1N8_02865 [Streptomyces sp. DSM 116494]
MAEAFGQFQYPTPPLAVSYDFANTMMLKAIDLAFDNDPGTQTLQQSGRR